MSFIVILLTSCSFGGSHMRAGFLVNDTQVANNSFEKVILAIQNRDENALRSSFSKKSVSEDNDFDESIVTLFHFFEGVLESYNDWGGPQVSQGRNDDGTGHNWKSIQSTYDVETNEQKYRIAIKQFVADNTDSNNIGICSLYITKAEDSNLQFAYWGDGKWTPGITVVKK